MITYLFYTELFLIIGIIIFFIIIKKKKQERIPNLKFSILDRRPETGIWILRIENIGKDIAKNVEWYITNNRINIDSFAVTKYNCDGYFKKKSNSNLLYNIYKMSRILSNGSVEYKITDGISDESLDLELKKVFSIEWNYNNLEGEFFYFSKTFDLNDENHKRRIYD